MRAVLTRPFLLILALAALPVRPGLDAQQRAVLHITVRAAHDSIPLAGAQVLLQETGVGGVTNERGVLRIYGARAGTATVEVVMIGFDTWTQPVTIVDGAVTSVLAELVVDPVRLHEVQVTGVDANLEKRGFYERQRHSAGTFLTAADLEAIQPRALSDVLRRYGVQVGRETRGMTPTRMRGQQRVAGSCPIQYYIDGVPASFYTADEMRPGDVEGLEIYRGAATIPAAFKQGTALCGVIVIWTKVN
ncbi:MAG TPA: carboxypeptidase-like regulatory domain-containing protein [Longimicrobiales bacterium]|nr:carboxypeptidase-like regulatory domain-containing protein [Longimicrobiales bacterium]